MEGVKNLVIKKYNFSVIRVVDVLMDMKLLQDVDDFRYFDFKFLRLDFLGIFRNKFLFQEVYVFMVGGGNYIEYQNFVDYVKNKLNVGVLRKVVYGCSDLISVI